MTNPTTRWPGMHAGAVRGANGEKMFPNHWAIFCSTIREVLEKYHPESGALICWFRKSSHYRSAINYSEDNLKESKGGPPRPGPLERSFTMRLKGLAAAPAAGGELSSSGSGAAMETTYTVRKPVRAVRYGPAKSTASRSPIWMRRQVWRRACVSGGKPSFAELDLDNLPCAQVLKAGLCAGGVELPDQAALAGACRQELESSPRP